MPVTVVLSYASLIVTPDGGAGSAPGAFWCFCGVYNFCGVSRQRQLCCWMPVAGVIMCLVLVDVVGLSVGLGVLRSLIVTMYPVWQCWQKCSG
jgi:hypothetical protein